MSVLFAALLVAETILVMPFATKGDAPQGAGVAVAEAILDVVVQANADSFLTLKQLDSVLRRRDLRSTIPASPRSLRSSGARSERRTWSAGRCGSRRVAGALPHAA